MGVTSGLLNDAKCSGPLLLAFIISSMGLSGCSQTTGDILVVDTVRCEVKKGKWVPIENTFPAEDQSGIEKILQSPSRFITGLYFRADFGNQRVFKIGETNEIVEFKNCKVFNAENWQCEREKGTRIEINNSYVKDGYLCADEIPVCFLQISNVWDKQLLKIDTLLGTGYETAGRMCANAKKLVTVLESLEAVKKETSGKKSSEPAGDLPDIRDIGR